MAQAESMLVDRLVPASLYDPANMPPASTTCSRRCARTRSTSATSTTSVKDGQVVIVDEFTGRLMPGRRWSDGLHQAVEAKEKVKIKHENQTLATITFQNFFRKYDKLSGMTGTAKTEADEFAKIYKLDVIVDPDQPPDAPHRPPGRDLPHRAGEVRRDRPRTSSSNAEDGPAGAGRHRLDREVRAAVGDAEAARREARRAQRQVPRAGGRDRRPGRPPGRGRRSPPTWPAAAPTFCSAATPSS